MYFPEKYEWKKASVTFKKGSLQDYMDDSKLEDRRTDIGIYGPKCNIGLPLGTDITILQVEIMAIAHCARIIQTKGMKGATINIISDSQVALKALRSVTCESRLVLDCLISPRHLVERNKVSIWWVPGHKTIQGNVQADQLAKAGAEQAFIGP